MNKLFAVVLLLVSSSAFADVGLFFDGTHKYVTGFFRQNVPAPLYVCYTFPECDPVARPHARVGVFFSNFAAMNAEINRRMNLGYIASSRFVHTKRGKGYTLDVADVVDIEGREYVMIGISTRKKDTKTKKLISMDLVGEVYQALNRSAY